MQFSNLLQTFMFPPKFQEIKSIRMPFKPIFGDVEKLILYEYFIPLDAISFYFSAYSSSNSTLNELIYLVLESKKLIVENFEVLKNFENYSENVNNAGKVINVLKKRNMLIKGDSSGIFKELIMKKQNEIKIFVNIDFRKKYHDENFTSKLFTINASETINELKLKTDEFFNKPIEIPKGLIKDINSNREYIEMIYRIRETIVENQNLSKRLKIEKNEFYSSKPVLDSNKALKTKISLSLGGAFIRLPSLLSMINKMKNSQKEVKIREMVNEIMKSMESIELKLARKSFVDQKSMIKETLEKILKKADGEYDKIFEIRSELMKYALKTPKEFEEENRKQEESLRNMIRVVDNMKSESWIIKYNRSISENLINFLTTNQEYDKEKLLKIFED